VYSGSRFPVHKIVKYPKHSNAQHGGTALKEQTALKERDTLEAQMATVFGGKIKELSTELQKILIDDMVTAFENRLKVLTPKSINTKTACSKC
jgi:hypothetical protein